MIRNSLEITGMSKEGRHFTECDTHRIHLNAKWYIETVTVITAMCKQLIARKLWNSNVSSLASIYKRLDVMEKHNNIDRARNWKRKDSTKNIQRHVLQRDIMENIKFKMLMKVKKKQNLLDFIYPMINSNHIRSIFFEVIWGKYR